MFKKLLSCLFVLFVVSGCDASKKTDADIQNDKIYFFYYEKCVYCHQALDYIKKKYPNLTYEYVDVYQEDGFKLFEKCGNKFNLGRNIGTPLFCMGDKHIMGWSDISAQKFDEYVKPFLKK